MGVKLKRFEPAQQVLARVELLFWLLVLTGAAALIPDARSLEIEGKDHSTAVGAKPHRDGVLAFLAAQP